MKIFDCTTFFDENLMLEVRFNILNQYVDKFVVDESRYSHSGDKKKLNSWYKVAISEGRNHEIKRMWDTIGYRVNRLMRVSYGPIVLPRALKKGKYSHLSNQSAQDLYDYINALSEI